MQKVTKKENIKQKADWHKVCEAKMLDESLLAQKHKFCCDFSALFMI